MEVIYVHDNGGRPFQVFVNKEDKEVYIRGYEDIKIEMSYVKFFFGADTMWAQNNNTVLFEIGRDSKFCYIWVGWKVIKFRTNEPIKTFITDLGPNDVPYPYCLSKSKTYLILEEVMIDNIRRNGENPYQQFYAKPSNFEKFETEVLVERHY